MATISQKKKNTRTHTIVKCCFFFFIFRCIGGISNRILYITRGTCCISEELLCFSTCTSSFSFVISSFFLIPFFRYRNTCFGPKSIVFFSTSHTKNQTVEKYTLRNVKPIFFCILLGMINNKTQDERKQPDR